MPLEEEKKIQKIRDVTGIKKEGEKGVSSFDVRRSKWRVEPLW